jgi:hypothetical protein
MTTATIPPARAEELLTERASAQHEAQQRAATAPIGAPPPGAAPAPAPILEPVSFMEHSAMVGALVGEMVAIGGQDPDPRAVTLATALTYPANKRWGRMVDDVPAPVALAGLGLGLLLLAKACGCFNPPPVLPPQAPAPAGQGRAPAP